MSIEIRDLITKIPVIAFVNIILDWFRRRNAYFFWCKAGEVIKLYLHFISLIDFMCIFFLKNFDCTFP